MRKSIVLPLVLLLAWSLMTAAAKELQSKPYVDATVLRVDKHESSPQVGGDNPSDAPMPDPETFSYDIAVQVNCGTYVGRYQSWYDYVPALFAPDQRIQLRLTRSMMYVPVPNQREVEMSIVSKHVERGNCGSTSTRASAKH